MVEMTSMSLDGESTWRLVTSAQQGDRAAADRLVREHDSWVRSAIYAVAGRAGLVDDIAQQVWTRAWEQLGTLGDPRRLRSWLYVIARNTAIDMCVAQRRRAGRTEPLSETIPPADARTSAAAEKADSELHGTLLRAVQSLPALYREPFVLRHLNDWSYAEIGDVLGLSVETVETRLVRARRLLREMLQNKVAS